MTDGYLTRRMILAGAAAGLFLPNAGLGQSAGNPVEGGIGGTGIVGLLTEFGSLVVSGNYIKTDALTQFSNGFGALSETDLKLGDSLTIEAAGAVNNLIARRVHVTHPLIGPIQKVSPDRKQLRINGVVVQMDQPLRRFAGGSFIAVSGLWRGRTVRAGSISQAKVQTHLVSGDVERTRTFGVLRVGGTLVKGRGTGSLAPGSFATVAGSFDPETEILTATRVVSGRFTGAAGPLTRLSVEGYLAPTDTSPGYKLAGLGHSFQRNLKLGDYRDQRMLFNGAYRGKFAAENALVLPEGRLQRNRVLNRLSRTER